MNRTSKSTTLLLTALLCVSLASWGCKKKPPPDISTTTTTATAHAVGDKVDVKWNGSWWKGEVLSVSGDKYRVHYTGWSSSWDELVTADRLRAPTGDAKVGTDTAGAAPTTEPTAAATAVPSVTATTTATVAKAASAFKIGDKVDVNWKGSWYKGQVIGTPGNLFRVHYLGYASSWDENVTLSRLRPWTGTAKGG